MHVPPHPHIGLQTVTWLLEGDVEHRDSVGSRRLVHPGELNVMTAGRGIAHSEDTVGPAGDGLHGVQLWTALPDDDARPAPRTSSTTRDLPVLAAAGVRATVFMGALDGAQVGGRRLLAAGRASRSSLAGGRRADAPAGPRLRARRARRRGRARRGRRAGRRGRCSAPAAGRRELDVEGPGRFLLLGGDARSTRTW